MNITNEGTADRNRRRYGKADDELVGYFNAAVGVRAQSYEPASGEFNSHEAHYGRLLAMQRGSMAWFDRVAGSIGSLPPETRRVIVSVYTPHGWPTWLASALATPWGGGCFVALAATLPRASAAADDGDPAAVLNWFHRQGRGGAETLFRKLKTDCEAIRLPALAAYDVVRVERIKRETVAAAHDRATKREERERLLAEELGRKVRREADRFDRKLRSAS